MKKSPVCQIRISFMQIWSQGQGSRIKNVLTNNYANEVISEINEITQHLKMNLSLQIHVLSLGSRGLILGRLDNNFCSFKVPRSAFAFGMRIRRRVF